MLLVVLLSIVIAGVIVFIQPRQYLSTATALPATSVLSDKATIFSDNIEGLYSVLGSADDLERVIGTAQLDTVYLAVTDQFNLFDHYKVANNKNPRARAARLLRSSSRVMKSEYGELKIKVWDTDKNLAPQLANAILDKLEAIHQDLQNEGNKTSLNSLLRARETTLAEIDSINSFLRNADITPERAEPYTTRRKVLNEQLEKFERLISEYQLMLSNKPAVLMVVERAKQALRPDKPKRLYIMIAVTFLSLVFALLAALVLERKKASRDNVAK